MNINITLNDEKKILSGAITVWQLLKLEDVQNQDMLSIVLNNSFLHKDEYKNTTLKEGDTVAFLYFMGGGA